MKTLKILSFMFMFSALVISCGDGAEKPTTDETTQEVKDAAGEASDAAKKVMDDAKAATDDAVEEVKEAADEMKETVDEHADHEHGEGGH